VVDLSLTLGIVAVQVQLRAGASEKPEKKNEIIIRYVHLNINGP
jgi:hypothetical protein